MRFKTRELKYYFKNLKVKWRTLSVMVRGVIRRGCYGYGNFGTAMFIIFDSNLRYCIQFLLTLQFWTIFSSNSPAPQS
jgi:hypothetical protein